MQVQTLSAAPHPCAPSIYRSVKAVGLWAFKRSESKRVTGDITLEKPYLISYDLDKPGQNYDRLIARLKEHGAFRVLLSQWALKSTWTPIQLRDDLRTYVDSNDRLLVTEVGNWASLNLIASDKFKEIAA